LAAELRIAFLVLLFLTGILLLIRTRGALLGALNIGQVFLDFLIVPLALGTALTFLMIIFRIDPLPIIRTMAYHLSFQQNVSFAAAIPPHLENNMEIEDVRKMDPDGDDFSEWVVAYRYDERGDEGPIHVAVFDNDRGNPPVLFPYVLRPPDRDYLSETTVSYELLPVTEDENGPYDEDLDELLVRGGKELGIFRFNQNSEIWDFPRDAPPRYEAIGFFRGDGGISFDEETKQVTVLDRGGYDRSQLVARSVYALNPVTNTYWDQFYGPTELDRQLAAPVFTTIEFFGGPPQDLLDAFYPEKIVLAFYILGSGENWDRSDLVAGDAAAEYNNGKTKFFGLPSLGSTPQIAVTHLEYYPSLETDPDLLVTGGGRDVVTGEEAQQDVVDVTFVVGDTPLQTIRYKMEKIEGRWKIAGRLSETAALD
jgi:hypothetical protein